MEGEKGDAAPAWLQPSNTTTTTTTTTYNNPMPPQPSSNSLLNSRVLIGVLPIIALICSFIPSLFSLTSKFLHPDLIKRSWEFLNLLLVLFAVLSQAINRLSSSYGGTSPPQLAIGQETSTTNHNPPVHQLLWNLPRNQGLLIGVLALICAVLPWLYSLASQLLEPDFIRRCWDTFNFVLVVCATISQVINRIAGINNDGPDKLLDRLRPLTPPPPPPPLPSPPPPPYNLPTLPPPAIHNHHHYYLQHHHQPVHHPRLDFQNNPLTYDPRHSYNIGTDIRRGSLDDTDIYCYLYHESWDSYPDLQEENSRSLAIDHKRRSYDDIDVDGYRRGLALEQRRQSFANRDDDGNRYRQGNRRRPPPLFEPEFDYLHHHLKPLLEISSIEPPLLSTRPPPPPTPSRPQERQVQLRKLHLPTMLPSPINSSSSSSTTTTTNTNYKSRITEAIIKGAAVLSSSTYATRASTMGREKREKTKVTKVDK